MSFDPITFDITNFSTMPDLFVERFLYEVFFLSGMLSVADANFGTVPGIKDYWKKEMLLYGKVDKRMVGITPDKDYLKPIKEGQETFYALSAVAEAYEKFRNFFPLAARDARLVDDEYLQQPKISRAYEDGEVKYNEYLTNLIDEFNKKKIAQQATRHIKNIKDYADFFFKEASISSDMDYITRTSYGLSSNISSLNSGLSIEIADLDASRNSDKQIILQSPNFTFYKEGRHQCWLLDR